MTISTRRFSWRPLAVSFDERGCDFPNPFLAMMSAGNTGLEEIVEHALRARFRQLQIEFLRTDAVGMTFDAQMVTGGHHQYAGNLCQHFARFRLQVCLPKFEKNIRQIQDEAAGGAPCFNHLA